MTGQEVRNFQVEVEVSATVNVKAASADEARRLACLGAEHSMTAISSMVGLACVNRLVDVGAEDFGPDEPYLEMGP